VNCRLLFRLAAAAAVLACCTVVRAAAQQQDTQYRLQRGDVIQVRLYYNPDLSELLPIRPDGRISLALIGEVDAAGLTPAELSSQLTDRYRASLRQPETVVIVKEFAAQRVYVGGQVARPGIIALPGQLTALQGVVEAGGFVQGAKLDSVVILRDTGMSEPLFLTVNLRDPLDKRGSDVPLQAGDIVFVPKTRIATMSDFVSRNLRELSPIPLSLGVSYILGNAFVR
jgi:protein involved in polysaccharide export with SLBB domain